MELIDIGTDYNDFFKILPGDWQETIVPLWEEYRENASIFVFKNAKEISAGGIVFRDAPPNMTAFEIEDGQRYVASGFHYIGFLFVAPKYRGLSLGSKWLSGLKEKFPHQVYWLTIEEEGLRSFYEKNGFKCVAKSRDEDNQEWILIYQPL